MIIGSGCSGPMFHLLSLMSNQLITLSFMKPAQKASLVIMPMIP